jgi:hypothetical protein
MADDVDDLLRRAMKTLDDQVPSGYFEALADRTLLRLEDVSMQPTGSTGSDRDRDASTGIPPMKDREEDSGLHDIRSLASSTKARLSSRRSTQNPVMTDEDVLASSSAGWKAVALPEPAKMISLPELTELPSAKEIKEKDKAARKAEKVAAKAPAAATATAAPSVSEAAPAVSTSIPSIGSRIAAKKASGGKGKVIAVVGLGLAAAAGVTLFMMNKDKNAADSSKENTVAATAPAADYKSTAKMLPPPPPPPAPPADVAAGAGSAAAPEAVAQIAAAEEPAPAKAVATKGASKPGKADHKVEIRDTSMTDRAREDKEKAPAKKEEAKKPEGGGEGEPSFDALLKEAGVSDQKQVAKPKLDKKSLSGADIKTGMGAVAGKAQACYAGTQGTASVKLTVAPSGQITKVSVGGVFAGTPVAACVEAAVKSTSFPAWDGGPQSFNYSYLLSE